MGFVVQQLTPQFLFFEHYAYGYRFCIAFCFESNLGNREGRPDFPPFVMVEYDKTELINVTFLRRQS